MRRRLYSTGNLWLLDHGCENSQGGCVEFIRSELSLLLNGRTSRPSHCATGNRCGRRNFSGDGPTVPVGTAFVGASGKLTDNIVRVGENYKFF
jgi:hypothetical protein